ncbi:MAG: lipoprotein N-acyltransferase Lnb domain-containing protein [Gemmatimonadaceae bacterium]
MKSRLPWPVSRLRSASVGAMLLMSAPSIARAQAVVPPVPGSQLEIYVMTMGVGDAVWERFGHNALGIRDKSANTDIVYNWGTFSFTEADFLPRFIRGENRYWVAPNDGGLTVDYYRSINRSVWVQDLDLPPATRLAIRDFVEWNVREENKYYRYDYFIDNCSTRVRDALDRALGGALRLQFDAVPSGMSFRDEARRLMEPDPLTYTGIDIGLGRPSDREMSRFEAMFIPMRLRDALREMTVAGPNGTQLPLVGAEREMFTAIRAPEALAPANHQLRYLLLGVGLAAIMLGLARFTPAGSRAVAAVWCTIAGICGVLIVVLWTMTRHVWAYENVNLLFFNPLWIVLAVLVARRSPVRTWGRWLAVACGVLAVIGIVLGLVRWPQRSEEMALLVLAPHAAVLALLYRRKTA